MDHGTQDDLTALLDAAPAPAGRTPRTGWSAAYGELRRMAAGFMRRERTDHTLQPGALVNEAVIRLLDGRALARPRTGTARAASFSHFDRIWESEAPAEPLHFPQITDWLGRSLALPRE